MNDTEAHAKGQPKERELKKKTTDGTDSDVKMDSQNGEEEHLMKLQKKLTVQDGSAENNGIHELILKTCLIGMPFIQCQSQNCFCNCSKKFIRIVSFSVEREQQISNVFFRFY